MMLRPALLSLLLVLLPACGGGEQVRPNVLVISIDMLRADHVSSYGYERTTTPTIDGLATDGVRFARHVSSAPRTLPAHAAMFTSLPDSVHGCVDGTSNALPDGITTLAERYSQAGYGTSGFFAGPYLHPAFGLGQGFDEYRFCVPDLAARLDGQSVDQWAGDPVAHRRSHHGVTNPDVVNAASAWLREHREDPFFMFVHLWDAHFDFVPPAPFDARFGDPSYDGFVDGREFFFDQRIHGGMDDRDLRQLIALYDGEIMWCDAHVKLLLELLDELQLADDTIVVVTSDHGTEFFDHGSKGHRRTLYGEAINIPLVIRAPGRLPRGMVVDDLTRMVDLGPTLMELSGLAPSNEFVGQSLAPLARGEDVPPRIALSELLADQNRMRSVISGQGKLVWNEVTGDAVWFDLASDPKELKPQRDLTQGLGLELLRALQAEMETIERVAEQHQYPWQPIVLPPALDSAIRASGYGGGDK